MNRVVLLGYVGTHPDIRTTDEGKRVATLSFTTNFFFTDKNCVRQTRTELHKILIEDEDIVRIVDKEVSKGDKLYLEGKLRILRDDKGNEKAIIIVERMEII